MKNFVIMYLANKYEHIADYLTIQAKTEDEVIEIFNTKYPTYYFVEIGE